MPGVVALQLWPQLPQAKPQAQASRLPPSADKSLAASCCPCCKTSDQQSPACLNLVHLIPFVVLLHLLPPDSCK